MVMGEAFLSGLLVGGLFTTFALGAAIPILGIVQLTMWMLTP